MGKLIVMVCVGLVGSYLTLHFFPGVQAHAFDLAGLSVSWLYVTFAGFMYLGHRLH